VTRVGCAAGVCQPWLRPTVGGVKCQAAGTFTSQSTRDLHAGTFWSEIAVGRTGQHPGYMQSADLRIKAGMKKLPLLGVSNRGLNEKSGLGFATRLPT
jgi:hypothetical protein